MDITASLKKLHQELDGLYQLESSMAVLGYDQQVLMPPGAASGRAKQLAYLNSLHHQKLAAQELWELVSELSSNEQLLDNDHQVIIRELHRNLDRSRKLSPAFVAEKAKLHSESFSCWSQARGINDWASVQPYLERIVDMAKEEAESVGYSEHRYDALLDAFEPYSKLSEVKPMLLAVAKELKEFLPELAEHFKSQSLQLEGEFPANRQQDFCRKILGDIGFSFEVGRIDASAHPFMSTLGPKDIRITTRYDAKSFLPSLFGTIHEAGHAFYELGLPVEFRGTPRGTAVSMGIHESQSRLWENMVARSRPFCEYLSALIPDYFDSRMTSSELWLIANKVKPSLIRVEADEVTYTLHIVIRMLLEESLISGDLKVADLPQAWNQLYQEFLGLQPANFKDGVMQDVHWYSGAIGYFPSYALGNIYAAMFVQTFEKDVCSLFDLIDSRDFNKLNSWLSDKIYSKGQTHSAIDLVEKVCDSKVSAKAYLDYLKTKFDVA